MSVATYNACMMSRDGSLGSPDERAASDVSMLSRSASSNSRDSSADAYCASPLPNRLQPAVPAEPLPTLSSETSEFIPGLRVEPLSVPVDAREALGEGGSCKADSPGSPTSSSVPKPTASSPSRELVFDLDDAAFTSDYFRMYEFKVKRCPRARPHDWTQCPFAHPGEKAKRRDPRRSKYTGVACPDFRKGFCRRGDNCQYAHGVFECWLHPSRYRTQMCTDGKECKRRVCFFAHLEHEIRNPEDDPSVAEITADVSQGRASAHGGSHGHHSYHSKPQAPSAAAAAAPPVQQQQDVTAALSTLLAAQQSGLLNTMQSSAYMEVLSNMAKGGALSMLNPGGLEQQVAMMAGLGGGAPSQLAQLQMLQAQAAQQQQAAAMELQLRLLLQQQQQAAASQLAALQHEHHPGSLEALLAQVQQPYASPVGGVASPLASSPQDSPLSPSKPPSSGGPPLPKLSLDPASGTNVHASEYHRSKSMCGLGGNSMWTDSTIGSGFSPPLAQRRGTATGAGMLQARRVSFPGQDLDLGALGFTDDDLLLKEATQPNPVLNRRPSMPARVRFAECLLEHEEEEEEGSPFEHYTPHQGSGHRPELSRATSTPLPYGAGSLSMGLQGLDLSAFSGFAATASSGSALGQHSMF